MFDLETMVTPAFLRLWFAPFARRLVTQLFQRPDPRQRHQTQQLEEALEDVKSLGQLVQPSSTAQQSCRQQGRQRQQHSTLRYVAGGLKLDRRRLQFSHRRRHSFQRTRRAVSHRRLAVDLAALALVGYLGCDAAHFFEKRAIALRGSPCAVCSPIPAGPPPLPARSCPHPATVALAPALPLSALTPNYAAVSPRRTLWPRCPGTTSYIASP